MRVNRSLKILYVATFLPYPPNVGGKLRVSNLIKQFSVNHQVYLASLLLPADNKKHIEDMGENYASVSGVPHKKSKFQSVIQSLTRLQPYEIARFSNDEMKALVKRKISEIQPDIIWTSRLAGTQFIPKGLDIIKVLDQHDLNSYLWSIEIGNARSWLIRLYAKFNLKLVQRYENSRYPDFDVIVSVSDQERKITKRIATPGTKCITVENGVDIDYFKPGNRELIEKYCMVMTGSMNQRRNIDAAIFFSKKIFPQLKVDFPEINFVIVGKDPAQKVIELSKYEGIEVTGTVPDVRPYLEKAQVVVLPYRMGSGVKHKLPIAMAMAKPIVTTSNGCQGIDIKNEVHALIADGALNFTYAVGRLLSSPNFAKKLAQNARRLALQQYSWDRLGEKIQSYIFHSVQQNI